MLTIGAPTNTPVLALKLVEAARFLVLTASSTFALSKSTYAPLLIVWSVRQPHSTLWSAKESVAASLVGACNYCTIYPRELLVSLGSALSVSTGSTLGKLYTNGVINFTPVLSLKLVDAARILVLAALSSFVFLEWTCAILSLFGTVRQLHWTSWPARVCVVATLPEFNVATISSRELFRRPHRAHQRLLGALPLLVSLRAISVISTYSAMVKPDLMGAL